MICVAVRPRPRVYAGVRLRVGQASQAHHRRWACRSADPDRGDVDLAGGMKSGRA
jgi:hypothetical protein